MYSGLDYLLVAVTLVLTITSAIICHRIAKNQHGDLVFWGVLGFLIGPAAIPFTLFLAGRTLNRSNAA